MTKVIKRCRPLPSLVCDGWIDESDTTLVSPSLTSPTTTEIEEIKKRYIACPECESKFDTDEHIPRLLQCIHTICNCCVKKSINNSQLKCPMCKHTSYVGQIHESSVQQDQYVIDLLNFIKSIENNSDIICTNCEENQLAKYRCIDCPYFLCSDCYRAHIRTNLTKNHKLLDIENLKSNPYFVTNFMHERCCTLPGHESIAINLFCSGKNCNKPICAVCASTFHSSGEGEHCVKNLSEIYGNKKNDLRRLLDHIGAKIYISKVACKEIESKRANVAPTLQCLEYNIDKCIDTWQNALERRREELKESARLNMKEIEERLKKRFDEYQKDIKVLRSNQTLAKHVIQYDDPTGFLSVQDSLTEYLKQLVSKISIEQLLKPFALQTQISSQSTVVRQEHQLRPHENEDLSPHPSIAYKRQDSYSESYRETEDDESVSGRLYSEQSLNSPRQKGKSACIISSQSTVVPDEHQLRSNTSDELSPHPSIEYTRQDSYSGSYRETEDDESVPEKLYSAQSLNSPRQKGKSACIISSQSTVVPDEHQLRSNTSDELSPHPSIEYTRQDSYSGSYRETEDDESVPEKLYSAQSLNSPRQIGKSTRIAAYCYEFPVRGFQKLFFLMEEMKELLQNVTDILPSVYNYLCRAFFETLLTADRHSEFIGTQDISHLIGCLKNQFISCKGVKIVFLGNHPSDEILKAISPKTTHFKKFSSELVMEDIFMNRRIIRSEVTAYVLIVPQDKEQHHHKNLLDSLVLSNRNQLQAMKYFTFIAEDNDVESTKRYMKESFLKYVKTDTNDVIGRCANLNQIRAFVSNALTIDTFNILKLLRYVMIMCLREKDDVSYSLMQSDLRIRLDAIQDIKPLDEGAAGIKNDSNNDDKVKKMLIKDGITDIDSLLTFDPTMKDTLLFERRIPSEIIKRLSSLSQKGVVACGLWQEELKIFVEESNQMDLEKEISDIFTTYPSHIKQHKIIRVKEFLVRDCVSHGDRITNDEKKSGSLGVFAKDKIDTNKLLILTSGHVAQTGQKIYVDSSDEEPFGKCIYSTFGTDQHFVGDLAVVEVDDKFKNMCDLSYSDNKGITHNIELYERGRDELTGERVYKKGATSGWTKGKILDFHLLKDNREEMVVVEGIYKPFAEPGDSGSVVHMHDDDADMPVKLVTMVAADNFTLREEGAEGGNRVDLSKIAFTIVMNKTISNAKKAGLNLELCKENTE